MPLVSKETGIFSIPMEAPQKHPVTVDYKRVKVEEFKRALFHW